MSPPSSSDRFIDPNERLLASVIPPPPPTLRARAGQFLWRLRPSNLRRVLDWSRSREGRACFLAALAGGALMLGLYRSEASSAASTARPTLRRAPSPATATRASERSPSRTLEPERTNAALLPTAMAGTVEPEPSLARAAAEDTAPADTASVKTGSVRSTQRPARASKTLDDEKQKKVEKKRKRRAKPHASRRVSTRATRRGKSRRTTTAGPLPAWLANQRSKEASAKRR